MTVTVWSRFFVLAAGVTTLMLLLVFMTERRAEGGSDIAAPTLRSLSFDPAFFDASTSSKLVTVRLELEDETGVCAKVCSGDIPTQIMLKHVGSTQSQWASSFELVSGSFTDGVFEDQLTFPAGSATGTWEVGFFRLIDNLGNFQDLDADDLTNLGLPNHVVNQSGAGGPTPTPHPTSTPAPTQTTAPTPPPSASPFLRGDINCDGLLTAQDALVILTVVGQISDAPAC